jgi:hypothetical protein
MDVLAHLRRPDAKLGEELRRQVCDSGCDRRQEHTLDFGTAALE